MPRLSGWIFAFALIGFIWSQKEVACSHEVPRFGFTLFESWRKSFCERICASKDLPFPLSLGCNIKCPTLYHPNDATTGASADTTTESTMTSTTPNVSSVVDENSFLTAATSNVGPPNTINVTPSATNTSPNASSSATTALSNGTSNISPSGSTNTSVPPDAPSDATSASLSIAPLNATADEQPTVLSPVSANM